MKLSYQSIGLGLAGLLLFSGLSQAASYDLTVEDAFVADNDGMAFFEQIDPQSTGTGVIDSFVEVGGNTTSVHAYNTTVNGTLDNASSDQFNHEITIFDIPVVEINGISYAQFLLDINQQGTDPLLSLNEIQIFTSDTPNQSVETFGNVHGGDIVDLDGTLIWDLDADADDVIELDYNLNTGSGSGDMFLYVQASKFLTGEEFVYLYSEFGTPEGNNDGFEEWAVLRTDGPTVPIPGTGLLFGAGFVAFVAWRRRQEKSLF